MGEGASGAADKPTTKEMPAVVAQALYLVAFMVDGIRVHRIPAGSSVTVGRSAECDVRVDCFEVSRRHFAVGNDGDPVVRCLGSSNGTRVNGRRLERLEELVVAPGALIEAGGILFAVRDRNPTDAATDDRLDEAAGGEPIVLEDPAMVRLHRMVSQVARASLPVLVVGETGSGKEVIAAALHARSPRAAKPLVRVNCAALPEALLESELFGFERGAFTGAQQTKLGLIESANGGTFFLDEVGDLPAGTQAKLLRVLESGEVTRLGSLGPRTLDVRFVAATNRNLPALVAEGTFRRDLYYRLNGVTLQVPPLRERRGEIRSLARFFLSAAARRAQTRTPILSQAVITILEGHSWPGNVRELRNAMEQALVLCGGDVVEPQHVLLDGVEAAAPPEPAAVAGEPAPPQAESMRRGRIARLDDDAQRRLIEQALARAGGNQGRAAEILGVSRRTLINRLASLGLKRPRKG